MEVLPGPQQEVFYFDEMDMLADVEATSGERVTILSDLHMQVKHHLNEEYLRELYPNTSSKPTSLKRSRSDQDQDCDDERSEAEDMEQRRNEALANVVKARRTYNSSPEEIRLRQEIRTRRDHNKDWVRRWQDKTCKYRTINLCNIMNVNKVDQEQLRMEDMMKDVLAMKRRFEEKLKEREAAIKNGTLDPALRTGQLGSIKAEKMANWMRKVKEVSDLAETDGLDIETKMRRFKQAIMNMAIRANGIQIIQPMMQPQE